MATGPASEARFVVLRLSSLGDVVLAEPVTRCLKRAFPQSRIHFATYQELAEIPSLFRGVDDVITYARGGQGMPLSESMGDGPIEAVIDLQNNARSRLIAARLKANRVLRYRRPYARRFLAVYMPWMWKGDLRHTIDLYSDALRPLGIGCEGDSPELRVPMEVLAAVTAKLGPGPFVAICPGASSPHKMWGNEHFANLVKLLLDRGRSIVVVGSAQDRDIVSAVTAHVSDSRVLEFVGGGVKEIAAALALCRVTVSNDSGLLHLAAGVGSRVVAIWGPTSPLLGFAPRVPGSIAVSRGLGCSPCSYHGNRPCRYKRVACFEDIQPSEVASVVNDCFANGRQG